MFLKVLILSVILVGIIVLALGIKMLFNPNEEFSAHSCAFDGGDPEKDMACVGCQIKELTDCSEETREKEERNLQMNVSH